MDYLTGKPLLALQQVFGHEGFQGLQLEAVEAILSGRDAFVFSATGSGKSICYQVPAIVAPGTAVVVSPLRALMKDQVDALRRRGVPAAALVGEDALDVRERIEIESAAAAGEIKLLYVSPERLVTRRFQELLASLTLSGFAIDEAHCISEWGHDFRPEYLRIPEGLAGFPDVPRMALTASASADLREEIAATLLRPGAAMLAASADRANVDLEVVERTDEIGQLDALLSERRALGSAIVYTRSRAQADELAAALAARGHRAAAFHAGLQPSVRNGVQQDFFDGRVSVVVATTAFGMGVDKNDVATVAHVALPETLEAYYQEAGRAGRDGRPALAWLAWAPKDIGRSMMVEDEGDPGARLRAAANGERVMSYVEAPSCRRNALLQAFGENHAAGCGHCDLCRRDTTLHDASSDIRPLLELIEAHDGSLGAGLVAEVLGGERTERVTASFLNTHPAFGALAAEGAAVARRVLRQCLASGVLAVDRRYATLRLTETGFDTLYGSAPLMLPAFRVRRFVQREANGEGLPASQVELWGRLAEVRTRHAARRGMSPQDLISDPALVRMLSSGRPDPGLDAGLAAELAEQFVPVHDASAKGFDTGLF